jgi:hypothetical protein
MMPVAPYPALLSAVEGSAVSLSRQMREGVNLNQLSPQAVLVLPLGVVILNGQTRSVAESKWKGAEEPAAAFRLSCRNPIAPNQSIFTCIRKN